MKSIKKFRDSRVCLLIYDQRYFDDMAPTANGKFVVSTHDYHLLYTCLDAFETKYRKESFSRKKQKSKEAVLTPGCRKETLNNLPVEIFAKFEQYCLCTDGSYRLIDLDRMRLINDCRAVYETPRRRGSLEHAFDYFYDIIPLF